MVIYMKSHFETMFPNCVPDGRGFLYYVTQSEHAIKKLDLRKMESEYMLHPDGYDPEEWGGVGSFIYHDDKIYLFEQRGRWLMEYSPADQAGRRFDLDCCINNYDNFAACVLHDGIVFAFASYADKVVKINLASSAIESEEGLCPGINYIFGRDKCVCSLNGTGTEIAHSLYSCGCRIGNDLWLFMQRKPFVIKYSLPEQTHERLNLPVEIPGCIHAVWKESLFYILSAEEKVYAWNPADSHADILFDGREINQHPYFGKIAVTDANIWMLPMFGNDIHIVSLEDKKADTYCGYPEDFCYDDDPKKQRYYGCCEDGENYYFAMCSANYMLIIGKADGTGEWARITKKEHDLNGKINRCRESRRCFYEADGLDMKAFIMAGMRKGCPDDAVPNKAGNAIWNYMKE